jgi:hypothetical protein
MTVKRLVVSGVQTSAYILANYPPASNAGLQASTSDMDLMSCDGIRWNVIGRPPIPPGAAMIGACKNLYTCFPTVNDIGNWNGSSNAAGAFRLYNGFAPYGYAPDSTAYTTASNGQLQLLYQGNGSTGNGLLTCWPYATGKVYANYGMLPSPQAGRSFHAQCNVTMSGNPTDMFNAMFLLPQEKNNEQDDTDPAQGVSQYEKWAEFDLNESGLGTNLSGTYRGAYLQWSGKYNWALTMAAAYASGTTSVSLSSPWQGETGAWNTVFQSGDQRTLNLVNGSAGPYTCTALSTTNTTTAVTIGYTRLLAESTISTTAIDMTQEHTLAATYDATNELYTTWVDNLMLGQVSTYNANSSNTFRDALHYNWIFQMASHGSPYTPTTMNLKCFGMWVP